MSISAATLSFDLRKVITPNRLVGIWNMMSGFRLRYGGAVLALGVAALSKTCTYLLLSYFIDNYIKNRTQPYPLLLVALGFVFLAALEGSCSFTAGRFTAQTAEGVTRRLRNYLFDHIQHLTFTYHAKTQTGELIQRCTSDVDAVRRFFADQAIGVGRVVLLFVINFIAILRLNPNLALISIVAVPFVVLHLGLLLQEGLQGVRSLSRSRTPCFPPRCRKT